MAHIFTFTIYSLFIGVIKRLVVCQMYVQHLLYGWSPFQRPSPVLKAAWGILFVSSCYILYAIFYKQSSRSNLWNANCSAGKNNPVPKPCVRSVSTSSLQRNWNFGQSEPYNVTCLIQFTSNYRLNQFSYRFGSTCHSPKHSRPTDHQDDSCLSRKFDSQRQWTCINTKRLRRNSKAHEAASFFFQPVY